jgi:hypothetical protein
MSPTNPEDITHMKTLPYREIIGSLLYITLNTCPDIAFSIKCLAHFSHNPGKAHWKAACKVLQYLKSTINYKLTYRQSHLFHLSLFTDASFRDAPKCLSSIGYVLFLGDCLINWKAMIMHKPCLSMMESEVYSANARSKEGIWAINLLTHFLSQLPPCILNINNEKAELFINDQKITKGTIHYDIDMFTIRHWV